MNGQYFLFKPKLQDILKILTKIVIVIIVQVTIIIRAHVHNKMSSINR